MTITEAKSDPAQMEAEERDHPWLAEADRAMRLPEVERTVGYKRSTIYEKSAKGEFPQPYKLGARAVAWSAREVFAWNAARKQKARSAT